MIARRLGRFAAHHPALLMALKLAAAVPVIIGATVIISAVLALGSLKIVVALGMERLRIYFTEEEGS